jgi:hypothetical protein
MKGLLFAVLVLSLTGCLKPPSEDVERIESDFEIPTQPAPPVPPPPIPGFIGFSAFEDVLVLDAQSLSQVDAQNAFYLVGCDRHNLREELQEFKLAVDKGVNMISSERFLTKTVSVGPNGCIYRIDQTDYGLSDSELMKIAHRNPFNVVSNTIRGQTLKFYLQKEVTWAFADAFFLTAFEGDQETDFACDTYCDLIEQPIGRDTFLAGEGIESLQNEYDQERVIIGGTNDSPIAFGSRLVVHLESDNGFLTFTEDSSLVQPDSINENPFTFEQVFAGDRIPDSTKIFRAVAREYIGVLNNGLQLFRLENAQTDTALSAAPANVVFDNRGETIGLEPVIRLAACSGCHSKGSVGYVDELAEFISRSASFNAAEKESSRIFHKPVIGNQILNRIDQGQEVALAQLGISARDRDPFNSRLITPVRRPFNSEKAAVKFFLTDQQYRDCLASSNVLSQNLGAHLGGPQNSTPLQVMADNFQAVIDECGLFQEDEL